ncbi:MAG: hypothetical protein ACLFVE_09300 [Chitinispirillaceae bacterium]
MNISDMLENLQALFPILIFVIWLIVVVVRQLSGSRETEADVNTEETSAEREPRIGEGTQGDLRRSLEDLFGLPREGENLEKPGELFEQSRAEKKTDESAQEKKEENAAHDFQTSSEPFKSVAELEEDLEKEKSSDRIKVDTNEIRKGIVWHEVLQPPLALRENTWNYL